MNTSEKHGSSLLALTSRMFLPQTKPTHQKNQNIIDVDETCLELVKSLQKSTGSESQEYKKSLSKWFSRLTACLNATTSHSAISCQVNAVRILSASISWCPEQRFSSNISAWTNTSARLLKEGNHSRVRVSAAELAGSLLLRACNSFYTSREAATTVSSLLPALISILLPSSQGGSSVLQSAGMQSLLVLMKASKIGNTLKPHIAKLQTALTLLLDSTDNSIALASCQCIAQLPHCIDVASNRTTTSSSNFMSTLLSALLGSLHLTLLSSVPPVLVDDPSFVVSPTGAPFVTKNTQYKHPLASSSASSNSNCLALPSLPPLGQESNVAESESYCENSPSVLLSRRLVLVARCVALCVATSKQSCNYIDVPVKRIVAICKWLLISPQPLLSALINKKCPSIPYVVALRLLKALPSFHTAAYTLLTVLAHTFGKRFLPHLPSCAPFLRARCKWENASECAPFAVSWFSHLREDAMKCISQFVEALGGCSHAHLLEHILPALLPALSFDNTGIPPYKANTNTKIIDEQRTSNYDLIPISYKIQVLKIVSASIRHASHLFSEQLHSDVNNSLVSLVHNLLSLGVSARSIQTISVDFIATLSDTLVHACLHPPALGLSGSELLPLSLTFLRNFLLHSSPKVRHICAYGLEIIEAHLHPRLPPLYMIPRHLQTATLFSHRIADMKLIMPEKRNSLMEVCTENLTAPLHEDRNTQQDTRPLLPQSPEQKASLPLQESQLVEQITVEQKDSVTQPTIFPQSSQYKSDSEIPKMPTLQKPILDILSEIPEMTTLKKTSLPQTRDLANDNMQFFSHDIDEDMPEIVEEGPDDDESSLDEFLDL